jgi:hypothetical protein
MSARSGKDFGPDNLVQKVKEYRQQMGLCPYAHELNGQGTACAENCPACHWSEIHKGEQSE